MVCVSLPRATKTGRRRWTNCVCALFVFTSDAVALHLLLLLQFAFQILRRPQSSVHVLLLGPEGGLVFLTAVRSFSNIASNPFPYSHVFGFFFMLFDIVQDLS